MHSPFQRTTSIFSLLFLLPSITTSLPTNQISLLLPASTSPFYHFRRALPSDLEDIVEILIDAFAPSATSQYIYQEWPKYRDYTIHCTIERFRQINHGELPEGVMGNVITVPTGGDGTGRKAVSVAFWKDSPEQQPEEGSMMDWLLPAVSDAPLVDSSREEGGYDCSLNLGLNTTRMVYMRAQLLAIEEDLHAQYNSTLYLAVLATHPGWDGHGLAARQLIWGKYYVTKNEVLLVDGIPLVTDDADDTAKGGDVERPITLVATPAGYPLYISEDFRGLKNTSIQRLDGDGEVTWYEEMVWEG